MVADTMSTDLPDPRVVGHQYRKTARIWAVEMTREFTVNTPEGVMTGQAGDYLCMGVQGEMWPIKRDIFKATYQRVPKVRVNTAAEDDALRARMQAVVKDYAEKHPGEIVLPCEKHHRLPCLECDQEKKT